MTWIILQQYEKFIAWNLYNDWNGANITKKERVHNTFVYHTTLLVM
jgi:hypothetical protein